MGAVYGGSVFSPSGTFAARCTQLAARPADRSPMPLHFAVRDGRAVVMASSALAAVALWSSAGLSVGGTARDAASARRGVPEGEQTEPA